MIERLTRWVVRFLVAAVLIRHADLAAVCTVVGAVLVVGAAVALWREQEPEWMQARAWLSAERMLA